jgi:arylsulfatase A-like enzyme
VSEAARRVHTSRWRGAVARLQRAPRDDGKASTPMHFQRTSRTLAVSCALLAALVGCRHPDAQPNVVLVSVDTLRRDAVPGDGAAARELPALAALARGSVRFEHAFAAAAWTLPSHASLLTGSYPHRHGAVHRQATLSRAVPSLPARLAACGYETVAFTDGGFLDASYGFGRGFHRYDDHTAAGVAPLPWLPHGGRPSVDGGTDLFARAIAYLGRRDDRRPLFLFVHSYAVHDYYKQQLDGRRESAAVEGHDLGCLTGERPCPDSDWERLAAQYRSELRRLDGGIATLLATVDARLGERPTWVVLLSDHGEGLDPANGAPHHGGALEPEVLGVPLLVHAPGLEPRRLDAPVSLVDVAPTLADLAGASRHGFDGRSLLPLLRGGLGGAIARVALAHRTIEAEEHLYWWRDGQRHESREVNTRALSVAVVHGNWWYERGRAGDELVGALRPTAYGKPPLLALRGEAAPWLRTRAVATAPRAESAELERTLASLGYGWGGRGAP